MERLRKELGLGVNRFLQLAGISKATYYRRKRGSKTRSAPAQERIAGLADGCVEPPPHYGYRRVWALLVRAGIQASPSTVYRWMKRQQRLQRSPRRQGYRYSPPPQPEQVGWILGLDFTHWGPYRLCNVIEYQSRICLASEASLREDAALAQQALRKALRDASGLGLPNQSILVKSDQGSAFKSQPFTALLNQHGCGQQLSAVGRPEGMGRVERFHRSLKEECLQFEEVESLEELQHLAARYRHFYNTQRPHQALGYKTPMEVIEEAKKVVSFS